MKKRVFILSVMTLLSFLKCNLKTGFYVIFEKTADGTILNTEKTIINR